MQLAEIFDRFVKEICGEGERYLRVRALSAAVRAVQVVRRLAIFGLFVLILAFVCAMSGFATAVLAFERLNQGLPLQDYSTFIFAAAIFGSTLLLLWICLRESAWVRASGLEERVQRMDESSPSASNGVDLEQVAALVERLVEKKLAEKSKEKTAQAEPPATFNAS